MKKILILIISILCLIGLFKFFSPHKNPDILDFFGKYYFDADYYLEQYPEIASTNEDPYYHYLRKGWLENKNPSDSFDTRFYRNANMGWLKTPYTPLQHYIKSKFTLKNIYIHPSQLKKATLLENPKYNIALVAVFQNEARFLKEWIEFYKLTGVEHFYLYNHLSSDNYKEILAPYIEEGIVDLYQITEEPKNLSHWNEIQTNIYTKLAKQVKNDVEWLLVVDTDEFLFPTDGLQLKQTLDQYNQYAAVSVVWKMFGSGNINIIPDDKLGIETLLYADKDKDRHVKTIVKPRYVSKYKNPHFPMLKKGYLQVNENKTFFMGPFSPNPTLNHLRINHYWARDWHFFNNHKLPRVHIVDKKLSTKEKQKRIEDLIEFNHKISSTYDNSILKYVPKLRDKMGHNG